MFSVIFDMDGTLLDTQRISIGAFDYAGGILGYENIGEHLPNLCGTTREKGNEYLKKFFPQLDVGEFRRLEEEYKNKNLVVKYKPGAEELLAFLKQNNIKMAVATGSSPEIIKERLGAVDAEKWFDVVLSGWQVENGKPAPDIFLKTAELLGTKPEDCFVFEDSINGIVAACKAGTKCIGIPDIVQFNQETKNSLFAELKTMDEAIKTLKEYL